MKTFLQTDHVTVFAPIIHFYNDLQSVNKCM